MRSNFCRVEASTPFRKIMPGCRHSTASRRLAVCLPGLAPCCRSLCTADVLADLSFVVIVVIRAHHAMDKIMPVARSVEDSGMTNAGQEGPLSHLSVVVTKLCLCRSHPGSTSQNCIALKNLIHAWSSTWH